VASQLPLNILLSQTLIALTNEFEREGAGTPPVPSLTIWSNVLQYVGDEGVDQRRLPARAHLSKRAFPPAIGSLKRSGYVVVGADPDDPKAKIVRPTDLGREAREAFRPLFDVVDKRWRKRFGTGEMQTLRTTLEDLVGQLEFELSHYPTGYGSADVSITGGPGQDWKFWPRDDGDTVSTLPLSALLSQALVAFAIDYEREGLALAFSATVLPPLSDKWQPLSDPPPMGITGNGRNTLERHGIAVVKADPKDKKAKLVRLTWLGNRLRDIYRPLVGKIEKNWQTTYDKDTILTLRATLQRIVGQLEGELPHHPSMQLHL
jgi:DNA-binding MarR family transcriptional regulator